MRQVNRENARGWQTQVTGAEATTFVGEKINVFQITVTSEEDAKKLASLAYEQDIADEENNSSKSNTLEEEIKSLDSQNSQCYNGEDLFNKDIRKINFKEALEIFESNLNFFKRSQGAALFLVQNSYSHAGHLYLDEIRYRLSENISNFNFQYFPIELSSEHIQNEIGILSRIAGYLGLKFTAQPTVQEVVDKICECIHSGLVMFLEFNQWNKLQNQLELLTWLVNNFWHLLIKDVQATCQKNNHRNVKIFAVINSDSQLKPNCFQLPIYCDCKQVKRNQFNEKKIVKITLENWKLEEIQDWLDYFAYNKKTDEIDKIASDIYDKSMQGIPRLVYQLLKEELKSIYYLKDI